MSFVSKGYWYSRETQKLKVRYCLADFTVNVKTTKHELSWVKHCKHGSACVLEAKGKWVKRQILVKIMLLGHAFLGEIDTPLASWLLGTSCAMCFLHCVVLPQV